MNPLAVFLILWLTLGAAAALFDFAWGEETSNAFVLGTSGEVDT